jgi:hypothetical protein
MSKNPITLELRDLMREAWDASGREEAGDRQLPVDATFDRFLEELRTRLARADRRAADWRGPAPIGPEVRELCGRALDYAAAKDATRGGEAGEGTVLLRGLVQALGVSIDGE